MYKIAIVLPFILASCAALKQADRALEIIEAPTEIRHQNKEIDLIIQMLKNQSRRLDSMQGIIMTNAEVERGMIRDLHKNVAKVGATIKKVERNKYSLLSSHDNRLRFLEGRVAFLSSKLVYEIPK